MQSERSCQTFVEPSAVIDTTHVWYLFFVFLLLQGKRHRISSSSSSSSLSIIISDYNNPTLIKFPNDLLSSHAPTNKCHLLLLMVRDFTFPKDTCAEKKNIDGPLIRPIWIHWIFTNSNNHSDNLSSMFLHLFNVNLCQVWIRIQFWTKQKWNSSACNSWRSFVRMTAQSVHVLCVYINELASPLKKCDEHGMSHLMTWLRKILTTDKVVM